MKNTHTFVVALDSEANIVEFNEYASKLTGYKKNEVLGKNWFALFIPEANMIEILEVFNSLFYGEEKFWEYTNDITILDGSKRTIKWNNTLIKNEQGRPEYIYSLGILITR